jgi:hypothetical protein
MGERVFDTSGQFIIKNAVFDVIMPELSPNAFKVLCVAIRQTWGWVADPGGNPNDRREWDRISYTQFMEKAGIGGRSTVSRAVSECLEAGYLLRHQVGTVKGTGKPIYAYSLNTDYELASSPKTGPGDPSSPKTGLEPSPKTGLEPSPKTGLTNTKEYKQTNGGGANNKDIQTKTTTLTAFGVAKTVAERLAQERSLEEIKGWLEYAARADGLNNPVAFVVARLRDGEDPPDTGRESEVERRHRYAEWLQQ